MKPESAIRSLNRRIKEIGTYFGRQSAEYAEVKRILYDEFGAASEYVLLPGGNVKKPFMSLSRSKKILKQERMQEKIIRAWEDIQKLGTVKEQAQRYFDEPIDYRDKDIQEEIREESRTGYLEFYVDKDYYEEWQTEINDEDIISDPENKAALDDIGNMFHETGNREQKWERIKRRFAEMQIERSSKVEANAVENEEKPHDVGSNDYDMSEG